MDAITEKLRGHCYRMLALCFNPPASEILLEDGLLGNLSDALQRTYPDVRTGAEEMERTIRQTGNEELAANQARLLVGPFGLEAAPYGALYLDGNGTGMGSSTMRVLKIYEDEGLEIDGESTERPDHVAVQLEFMYCLTQRAAREYEQGGIECCAHSVEVQREFLGELLLPWLEAFCGRIGQAAETDYYRALADCLLLFARRDMEYLKSLVAEVDLGMALGPSRG
jgi:TorA maturation chaperone TorD